MKHKKLFIITTIVALIILLAGYIEYQNYKYEKMMEDGRKMNPLASYKEYETYDVSNMTDEEIWEMLEKERSKRNGQQNNE